jgi:hypothetical protein
MDSNKCIADFPSQLLFYYKPYNRDAAAFRLLITTKATNAITQTKDNTATPIPVNMAILGIVTVDFLIKL